MKSYYTPLFTGVKTEREAKKQRIHAYKPKSIEYLRKTETWVFTDEDGLGLNRQKLYLVQDGYKKWRVVRHIHEWELDDPMEGNEEWLRLYRRPYLRAQTKRVMPWLAKKRRKK